MALCVGGAADSQQQEEAPEDQEHQNRRLPSLLPLCRTATTDASLGLDFDTVSVLTDEVPAATVLVFFAVRTRLACWCWLCDTTLTHVARFSLGTLCVGAGVVGAGAILGVTDLPGAADCCKLRDAAVVDTLACLGVTYLACGAGDASTFVLLTASFGACFASGTLDSLAGVEALAFATALALWAGEIEALIDLADTFAAGLALCTL